MPIVGKFIGDFTSFQEAVQKATVSLQGMETGAGKVESSLNRMVDQFSGRKIIQDAELMSQAFQELASKGIGLTNSELQRMGTVANEAIAKLKAGGETVPAGMQQIADAAAKIKPPVDAAQGSAATFFSTLKSAAGLVGIAFSAQAVISFGKSVFDTASQIGDASEKLGVSAEALQRFKFAAEQSGASLGDVSTAIGFMNRTLAGGDASTKEALQAAGLAFQDIRNMKPEDAFKAIAEAIKGVKDPMEQARIVTELWGRSAIDLLPAVNAGIVEVGNKTSTMSDQTIRDLKAAQDAWSAFGTWVTTVTGGILATIVKAGPEIKKALGQGLGDPSGRGASASDDAAMEARAKNAADARDEMLKTGKLSAQTWGQLEIPHLAQEFDSLGRAIKDTGGALKLHSMSADELSSVYARLGIDAGIAARASQEHAKAEEALNTAATAAVKAFKDHQKYLKEIADQTDAVNLAMGILVKDRLKALGEDGQKVLGLMTEQSVKFALAMSGNLPVVEGVGDRMEILGKKSETGLKPVMPLLDTFKLDLGDLSNSLSNLANIAGPSLGAVARGLATITGAADTAKTAIENIKIGAKAGWSMDGLLGMTTGISGIVSAALAAVNGIKALWSVFDRNKGRDAVVDFAESFGGFDALQKKLEELGDKGGELWVKLTQGVGRNNPEQAQRVIAEVEAALAKQADAQDAVTGATEEQAQATIETASQAAKALEELGPRLKTNEDEWRGWGDVVTAQIQKIADGLRGLPMGGSSSAGAGGFQSKDYGPVMDASGRPVVFTTNLNVSGRTLATVNAEAALGW